MKTLPKNYACVTQALMIINERGDFMKSGKELLVYATQCSMDDLVTMINFHEESAKLLKEVKRIRIKDGEKTSEMIKREKRKNDKNLQVTENNDLQSTDLLTDLPTDLQSIEIVEN